MTTIAGRAPIKPTGVERHFGEDEIIVSKTDTRGIITYCNDVCLRVAGYDKEEIFGKPHSLVRHPEMPRCVFKLLWDRLKSGKEIFAYVNNLAKNGDNYWVFAHVTPTFDEQTKVTGYHSSRRVPERTALTKVKALYAKLLEVEQKHKTPKEGMEAAGKMLNDLLQEQGVTYDEFIFSL